MAKMFYSLEEAAEKLGVTEEELKEMAHTGKLQQFRDRDKFMFKREEVDALSSSGGSTSGQSGGLIPLAGDSGDTDAIDLADTEGSTAGFGLEDPRQATGVSVFDADEVDHADPLAQTQVTGNVSDDSELSLESVGSGSGLLDLTRESDDTSLGAELLDEIYPGGEASDAKLGTGMASSGVFDTGIGMDPGGSGLQPVPTGAPVGPGNIPASYGVEESDPAGSGLGIGLLLGASVALFITLVVALAMVTGQSTALVDQIASTPEGPMYWAAGILVASAIFGVIGMFIGKARG